MCLAVPGQVLAIWENDSTRMANVDFGGVVKEVCLEFVPDIEIGEYTIVHVGFALQRLDLEGRRDQCVAARAERLKDLLAENKNDDGLVFDEL